MLAVSTAAAASVVSSPLLLALPCSSIPLPPPSLPLQVFNSSKPRILFSVPLCLVP